MIKLVQFVTVGVLLLIALTDALSCNECDSDSCPTVVCAGGKVLDECNCCLVCAKQKGEKCGGPWEMFGVCDDGLICGGNHDDEAFDGISIDGGICQPPARRREFFVSAPTLFRTQHEAIGYCHENGGRGVTYKTQDEYNQVIDTLKNKFSSQLRDAGFWTAMVLRTENGVKEIVTPSGESGWASWTSFSEQLSSAKLKKNFQYAILHSKLGNYRPGSWIRFLSSWNKKGFYAVCQKDIDECASNPCQNGAQCVNGINKYTCECACGFTGENCQTNVDECAFNLCQNGAQCVDGINGYLCECAAGFTGINCQTNVDECASNLCQNGAQCVDGINGYTCECAAGFTGENCQTAKPCQSSNGYNYRYVETLYSWQQARDNCRKLGGDLAHHGYESLAFRREVWCDHLNLCNDYKDPTYIGLTKVTSSAVTWEYLNGTPSPDDDTWISGQYNEVGQDCGALEGAEGSLRTWSSLCSWVRPSICEFSCN